MPEEMGSILSDVESTTSLFIGNQMEEKLASALVNKVDSLVFLRLPFKQSMHSVFR